MSYAIRRAGQAVIVLVLAYVVAYVLLAALPGDAVLARYGGPELGLSPEQLAAIRESYGADRPLIVRLGESAAAFAQGQLGYSVQSGAAVSTLLATAIPSTLVLPVLRLLVAVVLAGPIAFLATYVGARWIRRVFRDLPPLLVSLPVFWVGIILIQVLSFRLGLVPIIGASPGEALILPVLTIAVPIAAPLAQVLSAASTTCRPCRSSRWCGPAAPARRGCCCTASAGTRCCPR